MRISKAPIPRRFPLDTSMRLPAALLLTVAAAAVLAGWEAASGAASFLFLAIVFFFRDPERLANAPANAILSPADGRVIGTRDAGLSELSPASGDCISIFLSILDVHVNRAPCDGLVDSITYRPGGHCDARCEASIGNESNSILFRRGQHYVGVRQIAGRFARRVVCRLRTGTTVRRGDRIGLIRLGSRVEVYLPPGSAVIVRPGQKVRAGITVLGFLPEGSDSGRRGQPSAATEDHFGNTLAGQKHSPEDWTHARPSECGANAHSGDPKTGIDFIDTLDDKCLSGGCVHRCLSSRFSRVQKRTLAKLFDRDRIVSRRIDNYTCGQDDWIHRQRTRDGRAVGHDSGYLVVTHA